jgi:hypothetical protein
MMKANKPDISTIIADTISDYEGQYPLTYQQSKAVKAIINCRTEQLGSHIMHCNNCDHKEVHYNSCRNRHCPKCQGAKQEQWVEKLKQQLLPCRYFHVVFTIPDQYLNNIIYSNQQIMYDILIKSASYALKQVAANPAFLGAKTGCLAVLHTWGQNLLFHPHVHMLVPAGGLSEDKWEWIESGKKFFVPVKALSKIFRGKFVSMLEDAYENNEVTGIENFKKLKDQLYLKNWNVYCKKTFGGPGQVITYLGRYTHKIAISNSRVLGMSESKVQFRWKDYRGKQYKWKVMELETIEFVRRYLLHILPNNFYKIRYYGLFAVACRQTDLNQCLLLLGVEGKEEEHEPKVKTVCQCPRCRKGKMVFAGLLEQKE